MFALSPHPLEPGNANPTPSMDYRSARAALAATAALCAVLIASHWTTLTNMADRWSNDPQYSHGYIVPLFALVVLWSRRDMLKRVLWQPAWLGLGLLAIGA